jgi:hypothetical protein
MSFSSLGARIKISSNRKSQRLKMPTMAKCPFIPPTRSVFLSHSRSVRVQDDPRRLTQSETAAAPCTTTKATLSNASLGKSAHPPHTSARAPRARVRVRALRIETAAVVSSRRTSRDTPAGAVARTNAEARRQGTMAAVGTVAAAVTAEEIHTSPRARITLKTWPRYAEPSLTHTPSYMSFTTPQYAASRWPHRRFLTP